MSDPKILWQPSAHFKTQSNINNYINWVNENLNLGLTNYQDTWSWSVENNHQFWESILKYFQIEYSGDYSSVNNSAKEIYNTKWFEGISLNYAEHIFKNKTANHPAVIFKNEFTELQEITWNELEKQTANFASYLKKSGIKKGDRVCAMLPNCPQALIAFLATNSIGAVWTSCSPDFGTKSIIERFSQIEPKIFITTNGYVYNGRKFNKSDVNQTILKSISSIQKTVLLEYVSVEIPDFTFDLWEDVVSIDNNAKLEFTRIDFNDPIWILYSSGTTGKPKAITHSVGGILLEHFKAMSFHQNIKPGERFFWYSTTGWMMWNYAVSALLVGGTLAIYDGSPAYPTKECLWAFARDARLNHFGAGASYYIFCMRESMNFENDSIISTIKSYGSTGSPLPPEAFNWFYQNINKNAWVISLSGGTDICSGFVGGNPLEPVYEGEIQCRMLGVNLQAYSEEGEKVVDELGEMVIENAIPSMPIFFWNDKNNQRYKSSYFEMYPGKWRHGDWMKLTNRNTVIIYGRSDATLNRGGVRIGTSEVYSATESLEEIKDSLVVCLDYEDGTQIMPLFVQVNENFVLDMKLKRKIKKVIKTQFSPRHIPDLIIEVNEIPYTISGKKMEAPVKKILSGVPIEKAASKDAMKNPKALDFFANFKIEKA